MCHKVFKLYNHHMLSSKVKQVITKSEKVIPTLFLKFFKIWVDFSYKFD